MISDMKSIPTWDPQKESALLSFDPDFVKKYGQHSVFVITLADLWTMAMFRMLEANNLLKTDKQAIQLSNKEYQEPLHRITHSSAILKKAIFQEPFGFAKIGSIKQAFEQIFGQDSFDKWLDALESKDFDLCISITKSNIC